jgi:DNA mismatch repair protein MutS
MATTPMMAQYLEIKAEAGDALLFYRMGDFYELFFADAEAAAAALDIALTKRGQHDGGDVPMCGVPVHSADSYLTTLIRKGFRVAVCEQLETPEEARRRGSKSVVRRGIVRLVTPGTLTEDGLLDARRSNHLAAWTEIRGTGAMAWCDISTGAIRVAPCPVERVGSEVSRVGISELLLAEDKDRPRGEAVEAGAVVSTLASSAFDSGSAETRLRTLYQIASLDGFGQFDRAELSALGALVEYVELTQRGHLPRLRRPCREADRDRMRIDATTLRSLELVRGPDGGRKGSLLETIDRTVTGAGARLLERHLITPLCDITEIDGRLDEVEWALDHRDVAADARDLLRRMPDMARAVQRLSVRRGGPRDLAAIRDGLQVAGELAGLMNRRRPPFTTELAALAGAKELHARLNRSLLDNVPVAAKDGDVIASGVDGPLDEARRLRDHGREEIAACQARYATESGVSSLKVRHNRVLGYFLEVTATHRSRMEQRPDLFVHRQTTANLLRYTTLELADLELRIENASSDAQTMQNRMVEDLREAVLAAADAVLAAADASAHLDLVIAKALLAEQEVWVRPIIEEGRAFDIEGGRHPVVERALRREGGTFVTNGAKLTAEGREAAMCILTGPNMGGKSTWLRQNALIAVMAQAGCYVPATSARIGIVSQLFSRVGASDDLARGRSTFMQEMVETAAILNQADDRALVILDEIGRGTATFDGLSIAWASLEHLHGMNRCRVLFATHYHELTDLAASLPSVTTATVAVREWKDEIVFLHQVREGAAARSYGIQVGRLAGLPAMVVSRAEAVLAELERSREPRGSLDKMVVELPLFARAVEVPRVDEPIAEVLRGLRETDCDALSPKEALDLIYDLQARLRQPCERDSDVSRETDQPASELTPTWAGRSKRS